MDAPARAHQIGDRGRERGARSPGAAARAPKVVVNASVAPRDHGCQLAARVTPLGQLDAQRGERCLQCMRKIGDMPARVRESRLVLVDQGVELGGERRHFGGLVGGSVATTPANLDEVVTESPERSQPEAEL